MNVCALADKSQKRRAPHVALIDATSVWSGEKVDDHVSRLAGSLLAHGVTAADRVAVLLPSVAEHVIAFTAALRCGAVPVPLVMGTGASDLGAAIDECAPTAAVTTPEMAGRLAHLFRTVPLRIVVEGGAPPADWVELSSLVQDGDPLDVAVARQSSDAALICYTSGTSGRPKGVVYTHGSVIAAHRGPARSGDLTVLTALPLSAFGAWALTGRLVFRWTLIMMPAFEPRAFLRAIEQHRVQALALVPSMGEALVAVSDGKDYDLSSLRRITLTGAHVSSLLTERLTRLFGVAPSVGYGMTEVGGGIAGTSSTSSKRGSVGRVAGGVQVKILAPDGTCLPRNETGEICVKTPWMARGYIGAPDAGAGVFDDGWVRTGDLGYVDSDDELFLLGRRKDIVIQGGMNVNPGEVVDVITRLEGVRECAVVGMPHDILGEEVVACLVVEDVSVTERQVIEHCHASMDRRKAPVLVRFWKSIPRTALGKVDSEAIRRQLRSESREVPTTDLVSRVHASAPPIQRALVHTAIENALRRVLPERAVEHTLDPFTPFSEIGLDSMGAARLAHVLGEALGTPMSPVLAFSHPTIDRLTGAVLHQITAEESSPRSRPVANHSPSAPEPIAIVGIGCRLPGGVDTPERFWSILRDAVDVTADITRWDPKQWGASTREKTETIYVRRAAMLDSPQVFDAEFFGLSDREAGALDPQHRLFLEVAWEAIENAGYCPLALPASRTGVFLGLVASGDVGRTGLGEVASMAVSRLCKFLDLRGPALVIDTACSSSLAAVHSAVRSLRSGECDIALAGGVHVIRSLRTFASLCGLGVLSADGRCKAFDASADGYGRGEGATMVVLRRRSDAEQDHCRIMALIRGSAARHDGRSSSLTAPNGRAQRETISAALADAGVTPDQIDYVEAHGAGTLVGDPIEVDAAVAALEHETRPLLLGSVKSNVGHLEAAAGVTGLVKVALALEHEAIPAHLHYQSLNPLLTSLQHKFRIPTTLTPWPKEPGRQRLAGVTSMGLSGTNVHVIVEEPPRGAASRPVTDTEAGRESVPHLLCISARDPAALREQAWRYAEHLGAVAAEDFPSVCFTAAVGRKHFRHRIAAVAGSPEHARTRLLAACESMPAADEPRSHAARPRIGFLFSGQSRYRPGTARRLYQSEPAFHAAIDRCASIVDSIAPFRLHDALFSEAPVGSGSPDSMAVAQPALFALEWALAELWRSWGIEPDAVVGHSLGECVAACVAGVMSLEDALRLVVTRGRLLESLPGTGAMAAIHADEDRVRRTLAGHRPDIAIAAINGAEDVVIAGDQNGIFELEQVLNADGVRTKRLHIPRAAHSPAVDTVLGELGQVASTLTFAAGRVPIVSTVTGQWAAPEDLSQASYWCRQMRAPVRFGNALSVLLREGYDTFVEIGPSPVLTAFGLDIAAAGHDSLAWIPSLSPDVDDREQMLESLAELYRRGADPAWDRVYGSKDLRRVPLPTYPFQRREYWSGFATGATSPSTSTEVATSIGSRTPEPGAVSGAARAKSVRPGGFAVEPSPQSRMTITDLIRRELAETIGAQAARCSESSNLLQLGFDSIRVVELVGRLGRSLRVKLRPQDLLSNPTISRFATYVTQLVDAAPLAAPARHQSCHPLVALNERGSRAPVCCFHPSGGQVTCYLGLGQLLGADRPLFAIQSRALRDPAREHPTIRSMAIDYATIVESFARTEPCRLIGWSMGGLVAHATAAELERRGTPAAFVGLIDPVDRSILIGTQPHHELALALTAISHEALGTAPPLDVVRAGLGDCPAQDQAPALLGWCERHGLLPAGSLTADQLESLIDLYRRHFALTREYEPSPVAAPVHVWLGNGAAEIDPGRLGSNAAVKHVGGTHFSIMRSPYLEVIASDLTGDRIAEAAAGPSTAPVARS